MPVPIKYNANALALLFQQCQKNVLLISSTFNGFQGIRLILQSCIFSQFIIQFLFIKQAMNPNDQKREKELISVCKSIQSLIKSKSLKISDERITDWLTIINVQQYRSAALIQQIRNTRDLLLKQTSTKNHQTYSQEQQLKTNAYLSLAITSEILKNGQAESEYRIALSYDQRHPQINLSLALLLYHRQQYREALKQISKVTVKSAFTEKHRINIWNISALKVDSRLCWQLLKTNNSEQHIAKVQFIRKVMKFKEAFLYHCAEIQQLSEDSYVQLADLLYFTNRFADGLTLTYKLRNLNQPPTQAIQQNLAILFFMFNKFEESAECAKQGLRINPRNQQIHQLLILSLISLQQIPKAKVCAMGLISLNKYNSSAYQIMGEILSIQGSNALALEYSKLGVVIQPSEQTYQLLALQFSNNSIFAQAQRCLLKSIKIQPQETNYSQLGVLYFDNNAHLNAMLCYFEAITHNFLHFEPYFYLGLCAKRNAFLRSFINRFMDKLQSAHTQDPFLQTNLAAYKFVSNQSLKQIYAFLSNFMEERKKGGEETLYGDIANQLIDCGLKKQMIRESKIFSLIFGVLCRAKEQFIQANRIFVHLISEQASVNGMSLSFAFTSLYQSQISKTPKALQPIFLQFIIADMVHSSPAQALNCFHKSLSYAHGDYEQFYAEFYKVIERDIEQLWPISIIANSIVDRQPLDQTNQEYVSNAMDKHSFIELGKYTQLLGAMAQIVNALSLYSQKGQFWKIHQFLPTLMGGNIIRGLDLNVKQHRTVYGRLFDQIKNDQETVVKNIQELFLIYGQKGEIKRLKTKICKVMELYFDRFMLNQKVKLIFNHFNPYIITESCHKQFAVILHRIKECAQFIEYSPWELMEDLQNMFRQGNKHTNKEFKVECNDWAKAAIQNTSLKANTVCNSQFGQSFLEFAGQTRTNDRKRSDSIIQTIYNDNQKIFAQQETPSRKQGKGKQFKKTKFVIQNRPNTNNPNTQSQGSQQQSQVQKDDQSNCSSQAQQQNEWFQLNYYPSSIKFKNDRKYRRFNELLYENVCCLIKNLSRQSHLQYTARHICGRTIPNYCFQAKVELGDEIYVLNDKSGLQTRTLKWIQALGPTYVLRWITDIALGICELEELGIYHADLAFRNTIRKSAGNSFYFKLIDFDKAFKVRYTDKDDKSYECTKSLLDFWLKFKFDKNAVRAPIWSLGCQSVSDQRQSSTEYDPTDIIAYIFKGAQSSLIQQLLAIKHESIFQHSNKISKCLKLLREHMRVSHLKQYSELVEQLLESSNQEPHQEFMDMIGKVEEELQNLKAGKVDYPQFAKAVKRIGELHEQ